MEGIECHLCSRFANRLRCNRTYSLTSWCQRLIELILHLLYQAEYEVVAQLVILDEILAGEVDSQMDPEQLNTILTLELSLLLHKLTLLLLTQHPTILPHQLPILLHSLWWQALINQLLHLLINEQWTTRLLLLSRFNRRSDLIYQSLNLYRTVILDISAVLVVDEDLA